MKTFATPFLLLAVVMAGCDSGPDNSPDGLMTQSISAMNELSDGLEAGKTEEEMSTAKEKLEALGKKLEALGLSEEEKEALIAKHKPALEKASKRMMSAMMGSMQDVMSGAMNQMSAGMEEGMKGMSEQMNQQMGAAMKDMQQKMKSSQ